MAPDSEPVSKQKNIELLSAYEALRVADVRDGMDAMGYHSVGSLSPTLQPLWRTRAAGIARTARYLPYQGRVPEGTVSDYMQWSAWYYGNVCRYPWLECIEAGDFVVLDQSGVGAGLMGSENTLHALKRGVHGFVTNGGVRDTDEIILQQVPFWCAKISQGMVQSRLQFDAMDVSVCVGGQTVCPGDVMVADGDGVIVVPRGIAREVAEFAATEQARDRKNRRQHYADLGKPMDESVK